MVEFMIVADSGKSGNTLARRLDCFDDIHPPVY